MEDDGFINPVEEFWPEVQLQLLPDSRGHGIVIVAHILGAKADFFFILKLSCPQIGSHDNDRVPEVHLTALGVGQIAIIQDLQQEVEDVWVGLLGFIQEYNGVRVLTNLFGQLAPFVVTHVAWRGTNQSAGTVLLHVLGHIDPDHVVFRAKHGLGQRLG